MSTTNTYDILEKRVDFSTKYLQPREVKGIFNEMGVGAKLVNTEFHWWETYLPPRTAKLTAGYTAGSFSMVVDTVEPFNVGTIFEINGVTYSVSVINPTTKTLTIVLVDGTDAIAAINDVLTVISTANVEASEGGFYQRKTKDKKINVSQILKEIVQVSGSSMEVGKEVAGAEATEALQAKIIKMRRDMATMPWSKVRVIPTDNTTARIAGGIPYFIPAANKASGTFTAPLLSAWLKDIIDRAGGTPKEIWMNPAKHQNLSETFDASYLRRDINDGKVGRVATTYVTGTGEEFTIKTDVNIPLNKVYALSSSDVVWRPLRPMRSEPLGKKGDYYEIELLAEVSMEINPSGQMGEYTIV